MNFTISLHGKLHHDRGICGEDKVVTGHSAEGLGFLPDSNLCVLLDQSPIIAIVTPSEEETPSNRSAIFRHIFYLTPSEDVTAHGQWTSTKS